MSPTAKIISAVRRLFLQLRGAQLPANVQIERGVVAQCGVRDGKRGLIHLGNRVTLGAGVVLDAFGGAITCDADVWLGPHTVIYGHGGVEIGAYSLISMHCRVLSSEHTIPDCQTPIRHTPDILKPTRIGRDVWLGAGVTVLGGVEIGDHCVVGAGSVVTHDLPTGSIAMGTPARIVRQRPCSIPPGEAG